MSLSLTPWLSAARLRTLPLSVSGILVASAMAYYYGYFNGIIFSLALLTAIGFQLVSNFANDYGDGIKGTDDNRIGPPRAVQSGMITRLAMRKAIGWSAFFSFVCACVLIIITFDADEIWIAIAFFILGLVALLAAVKYTVGRFAYGYRGLGDIFVFVFFGLVSVLGTLYLYTKTFLWIFIFPAIAIGLFSVGVLNLNNMRDRETDAHAGKQTLVVIMGSAISKWYHYNLIFGGMLSLMIYTIFQLHHWQQLIFMLIFIPLIGHLFKVKKIRSPVKYDLELKRLARLTFLIAILFSLGHFL